MANFPVEGAKHKTQNDGHQCSDVVVVGRAPIGYVELLKYSLQDMAAQTLYLISINITEVCSLGLLGTLCT